jgi:hypothetical protein
MMHELLTVKYKPGFYSGPRTLAPPQDETHPFCPDWEEVQLQESRG